MDVLENHKGYNYYQYVGLMSELILKSWESCWRWDQNNIPQKNYLLRGIEPNIFLTPNIYIWWPRVLHRNDLEDEDYQRVDGLTLPILVQLKRISYESFKLTCQPMPPNGDPTLGNIY
jgi:hypothetical protein